MSLTLMATRSWPTVSCLLSSKASLSLVPTPSVPDTSTGSLYLAESWNRAPNPPMPPSTSGRMVFLAKGLALGRGRRALADLHRLDARGEHRVPDVVVVARGELGLGNAARRAAHGADAQALAGGARAAESDDAQGHGPT